MKTNLKQIILGSVMLLGVITSASALSPILSASWTGSQIIPDNNASGLALTFSLSAPEPVIITDVTVNLNLAGGFDGDIYAYLSHGSGFSVLLNRVGRTAGNPGGSGLAGFNVQLSDSYLTDIHAFGGSPLTGNFAPDGRNISPFNVVDTDARNATLGSFAGLDPNGTWTLFFADVSPLAVSTVQSWTVTVGTTVPEPGTAALFGLALVFGVVRRIQARR